VDDSDGGQTIGLPDFSNGVELKTIYGASSENTISKHIGKSKKKAGLSAIVIDISENNNPDDAKAIEYVRRSIARHNIKFPIYVLKHDGDISAI
jgi:3-keto-L-gulonate-6-phosphate decarboxylase